MRRDATAVVAGAGSNSGDLAAAGERWIVKRNCSASPRQLAGVLASIVVVSAGVALGFAACGLWLVLPFVGAELVALGVAFVAYARHAVDSECIDLDGTWLSVARHDGSGCREWRFVAAWTRVEVEAVRGLGARTRVLLASRGEQVEVGRHAHEARRLQLAHELRIALRSRAAPR
ncbi:MAG TPA: DUF2244 domain-containing protein [Burkholderiaceae bacterium]|nr:DUF2244 domain-containing protein [Burkholderiaceae bacterium]